jgi:hypothetical protein
MADQGVGRGPGVRPTITKPIITKPHHHPATVSTRQLAPTMITLRCGPSHLSLNLSPNPQTLDKWIGATLEHDHHHGTPQKESQDWS